MFLTIYKETCFDSHGSMMTLSTKFIDPIGDREADFQRCDLDFAVAGALRVGGGVGVEIEPQPSLMMGNYFIVL